MVDLKKLREEANLTQQELADQVGVIRQTISNIETGVNNPSVSLAKRIASVLAFDWTNFFDE